MKKNVLQNHYRQNYYIHTFTVTKYVCNYPALIVKISLKTPSLPFLLTKYNFVIVITVLVYVIKVHTNHIQCMYMSTKHQWCLLLLTWHNVHGLFQPTSLNCIIYFVGIKHLPRIKLKDVLRYCMKLKTAMCGRCILNIISLSRLRKIFCCG